jgi:hypothetical protein
VANLFYKDFEKLIKSKTGEYDLSESRVGHLYVDKMNPSPIDLEPKEVKKLKIERISFSFQQLPGKNLIESFGLGYQGGFKEAYLIYL